MIKPGSVGELNVRLNLSIAVVLLLIALAVVVSYVVMEQHRDIIAFSCALIGGMAGVYSAFYIGQGLRLRIESERVDRAFDLTKFTSSIELMKVRVFEETKIQHDQTLPVDLYEVVHNDLDLLHAVRTVLNTLESVSIAAQSGFADERVLYSAVKGIVLSIFERYRPFIEESRRQTGRLEIYLEFEKLADSWRSGKYISSGRTVPNLNNKASLGRLF